MRLSDVVFVSVDDVERVHAEAIELAGGTVGLRDRGLLESAVAAPRTSAFGELAHPSLARMAAALAHAVARNHAFVDGNKRAAFAATATFLLANGFKLSVQMDWARTFEELAAGPLTREELAALLAREMGGDVDVEVDD